MNQYCVYCSHCINDVDGLYCCINDRTMTKTSAQRANTCKDYEQSPQGHVLTGKQYRPRKWRYMRVYNRDERTGP